VSDMNVTDLRHGAPKGLIVLPLPIFIIF
jgi:hypothetical protein